MTQAKEQALVDWVASRLPAEGGVTATDVRGLLAELGLPREPATVLALEAPIREWGAGSDQLAFEPGGWKVNVTGAGLQAVVSAGLIWATLTAFSLAAPIPVVLVSAIIPRLFNIERVRLSRGEQTVLTTLALREGVRSGNARELYDALPDEIREGLNFLDFQDLLEKVVKAGAASRTGAETYELNPEGKTRFKLTFE